MTIDKCIYHVIDEKKAVMRIGMILDSDFPPDPRVENEAMSLIDAGHEVFLFCLDYTGKAPLREEFHQIHVHRVHVPRWIYSVSALAYTIPLYHLYFKKKIAAFADEHRIEAFHIHDMQIARTVFWVNKKNQLPIVLDLHENRPEIMKYYGHVNSFLGKLLIYPSLWKRAEFHMIRKADKVITITEEAAAYYIEKMGLAKEKFVAVPNTVRKKFYQQAKIDTTITDKYKDHKVILYLGDTGLRRGTLTAIEAMKTLVKDVPTLKLVLVGKSIQDNVLKEYVAKHDLEKYVDFLGWTDFRLFQSYIKAATVGICPIHRNLHHDTTYANKLFQYMSFGLPIVVSDCPSQKNLVENYNCGAVFTDRDVEGYIANMRSILLDDAAYKQLSDNALSAIKNDLNWESLSAVRLDNIYQSVK